MPPAAELPERVAAVAHVLYLIFTEGHTATVGRRPHRRLSGRRGDPADPPAARPAAGRERGDRPAGADAAHRLPAGGAHRRRGIARAARRAGPVAVGPGPHRRRASRSSRRRCPPVRSAPTSCRRRSPRCTPRPHGPRTPTGRRSRRSTGCSHDLTPSPVVTPQPRRGGGRDPRPRGRAGHARPAARRPGLRRHHGVHAVHAHLLERAGRSEEARAAYALRRDAGDQRPRAAIPSISSSDRRRTSP